MYFDEKLIKNILDNVQEGVYITDAQRKIMFWNKGAEQITGYGSDEVLGRYCCDGFLKHVDGKGMRLCQDKGACPLLRVIDTCKSCEEGEIYFVHKDGHRVPTKTRAIPLFDAENKISGVVELFFDNSSQLTALQDVANLKKLALIDFLTEAGNRWYIERTLKKHLEELRRYKWDFAVLFVDVDDFKKVNDAYGHDAGDKVLKVTVNTLLSNARALDFVGRWGGDEFIVVIINVGKDEAAAIAEKFQILIERSLVSFQEQQISITVSIGVTMAKSDDTVESLVKRADTLMYESKTRGKNKVSIG